MNKSIENSLVFGLLVFSMSLGMVILPAFAEELTYTKDYAENPNGWEQIFGDQPLPNIMKTIASDERININPLNPHPEFEPSPFVKAVSDFLTGGHVYQKDLNHFEDIPIIHENGKPIFVTQSAHHDSLKQPKYFIKIIDENTGKVYHMRANEAAMNTGVKGNDLHTEYIKTEKMYMEVYNIQEQIEYYKAVDQIELIQNAIDKGIIDKGTADIAMKHEKEKAEMHKKNMDRSAEEIRKMKLQLETNDGEPVEGVEEWNKDKFKDLDLKIEQGDPLVFSVDDNIKPCTTKMHPGQHESFHWNMDLLTMGVGMNMDRTLCEGSYVMFVDFNENGVLDNGYELMWHPDHLTYHVMKMIDYHEGNWDGQIDMQDSIWSKVKIMDWRYNVMSPQDLEIVSFQYDLVTILPNDRHGVGQYIYDGFRVMAYHNDGVTFADGTTRTTYAAVQSPLADCSIYDINYMVAEKALSEWRVDEALQMYIEGTETCKLYKLNEDTHMSHWVAGEASAHHRNGDFEDAKPLYEKALEMSPDRHFYLTDYAILLHQMGEPQEVTLPIVEKALEIDPDHGYAHTVKEIILG